MTLSALFIAQIGDFDFADYVRVGPSDGLDPYGKGWAEPQFAQSAFGDGQPLTGVTVGNREMVWPLYLNRNFLLPGDNLTPEEELLMEQHIHELVVDMNRALAKPNLQLLWCDSHAPATTYYDVAFARFDPDYNHRQDQFGWKAGTLRVWCSPPWGHTGTYRVVATGQTTGPDITVALPSLAGDAPAALEVRVTVGTQIGRDQRGRIVGAAVTPGTQYQPVLSRASAMFESSSFQNVDDFPATVVARPVNGWRHVAVRTHHGPASVYEGRNRVLMLANGYEAGRGVTWSAADQETGQPIGPTALPTGLLGWQLLDMGAFDVQSRTPQATKSIAYTYDSLRDTQRGYAQGPQPTYGAAGFDTAVGRVYVLPEDSAAFVFDEQAQARVFGDMLDGASGVVLAGQYDSLGNAFHTATAAAATRSLVKFNAGRGYGAVIGTGYGDEARWANQVAHRPAGDALVRMTVTRPQSGGAFLRLQEVDPANASYPRWMEARLQPQGSPFLAITGGSGFTLASSLIASVVASMTIESVRLELGISDSQVWAGVVGATLAASCVASRGSTDYVRDTTFGVLSPASIGALYAMVSDLEVIADPHAASAAAGDVYVLGGRAGAHRLASGGAFGRHLQQLGAELTAQPGDAGQSLVAIVAGVAGGPANDVLSVEVRAQERFTLAR